MTTLLRVGFVSLAVLFGQVGLIAQNDPGADPSNAPNAQAEDVPGRGVARVSLINGDVSVRRGDSGDLVAAAVNAALVAPDRVLTGPLSRIELQLDAANRLRVAADSDLRLAEIEYRRYTVELAAGTITWHVAKGSAADIDINTPSVSVRPVQPGDYRVTVNADGTTQVTARTGEAEIYSPRGVERVRRGKTTLVRGDKANPEFQTIAELREDEWDRFNLGRDRELDRSDSRQYLADDIVGAEELDNNGTWVDSAPYGRVWQPRVAAGWSPYSQGRWVWLDYYGWSWVSYDQFGWAPFHYGSWFNQGGNWCWYPGARHNRTWWRPAMVAWFGFGGVNVGVGFGNWGWVPLAPFEHFNPWYGQDFYGHNRTNIYNNIWVVNNYNIIDNYRNARVDGGARGVAAGQFGRNGGGRYDRVGETNLRNAGLMRGQLPASPARESLAFNDRRVIDAGNRGGYDGTFHSRRPTVTQERISFADQQRGVEQGTRAFGNAGGVRGAGSVQGASGQGASGQGGGMRGARSTGAETVTTDTAVRGGAVRGESPVRGDSGLRGDAGARNDSGARNDARGDAGWRRVGERSSGRAEGTSRAEGTDAVRGGDVSVRGGGGQRSTQTEGNGWRRFGEPSNRPDSGNAVDNGRGIRGETDGSSGTRMNRGGSGREVDSSVRGGGASTGSASGNSANGHGWRRFGDPTPSSPNAPDTGLTRGSVGDSVRESGREYGRGTSGVRGDSGNGNAGYGNSGYGNSGYGGVGDTVRESGRQSGRSGGNPGDYSRQRSDEPHGQPPNQNSNPDGNSGGYRDRSGNGNRSDSIRVNPPVLRDRSDSGAGGGWRGASPSPDQGGDRGRSRGNGRGDAGQNGSQSGGQYRSAPSSETRAPDANGSGSFGGVRGGGGNYGGNGDGSGVSGENFDGSRASGGGGTRNGGGRRGN